MICTTYFLPPTYTVHNSTINISVEERNLTSISKWKFFNKKISNLKRSSQVTGIFIKTIWQLIWIGFWTTQHYLYLKPHKFTWSVFPIEWSWKYLEVSKEKKFIFIPLGETNFEATVKLREKHYIIRNRIFQKIIQLSTTNRAIETTS